MEGSPPPTTQAYAPIDGVPGAGATKAPGEPAGVLSIERVVALLTPVFGAAAGYCFTLLGKAVPGTTLNKGDFTALFVTGAIAAVTMAVTWLLGRQKFVHFVQGAEHVTGEVTRAVQDNVPGLRQVEAILEAHEAAIVSAVADKIGAPPAAEDVAAEIVNRLWQRAPQTQTVGPVAPPSGP
jgi:hypothetical protein